LGNKEASKQLGLNEKLFLTFCNRKDVLTILPTVYEKSIVFAMLPLVFDER